MQGAQTSEDNLGSQSQPGPCGYIYFYPLATYPLREVATLGTGYAGHRCLTVPLLCGITVEPGFSINVKALHRRPDPNCGLLRATSYHRDIYVFHNAHMVPPIFEGPGLEALCGETREVFGYDAYSALPRESSKPGDFFPEGLDPSAYLGAVAITEAFKERLYSGNLVAIPSLKQEVAVGQSASVRVPLYDKEVFPEGVPQLRQFYNSDLSRCMHEALYTGLAQALRVRRVGKLVELLEKQSLQDQAKVAKVAPLKEFPASTISHPDSGALMIVDSAACELAVSYAPAMLEASHETPASLNYDSWPLFADCEGPEARVAALHRYNASLAPHVSTQIFATNSVLYVSGVSKSTGQGKESLFNSFYMTHGLGTLQEGTWDPCRRPCFSGWGGPDVTGTNGPGNYAVEHLVYAASFSPNLLARYAYYLQFCQGQKSSLTPVPETGSYVAGAAASPMCSLCEGRAPAVCLNTLFFRLRDRFPPVMSTQRRDPYVISGASGSYNETDFLGNFLNFIDKEDDGQRPDDEPRYTYWQLNQNLLERLSRLGIDAEGKLEKEPHGPRDFVKMFKDVDAAVDAEVVQFMNSMAKNNITYKDLVKSCYHVMQYSCNPFAQPACPIFTQLFYRSLLTILQDISLPICMCYENDNPGLGQSPPEWLKGHYQTLCTNFRSLAIDKGVLTAKEAKVVHGEPTCDLPDSAPGGFSTVPPEVAELSELLYWNSGGHAIGATGQGEGGGHSRLSALFARERRLALVRRACEEALAGARLTHLFDAVAPGATERLFCGGVYSSSGDAVEALKADCAAAFTAHPQYRAILQKRNELYTRLNRAMQRLGRGEEEASRESPEVPRPAGAREPGPSGALSDALKRKEQYLRQVATEGLAKLQSCLAQQSETLTETLCLRVWGDVVYWELARMRNHFLYRRAFVSGPWEDRRAGEGAAFENSKYIKTHLFTQTLSSEHLHALTHSLYTFITGPLAEESGLFPPPSNVALARCCDAAGTLPHQKAFLTSLIWPGIEPSDWIETSFNSFYSVPGGSLASSQQILCRALREAVLTVSLYNKTWGRSLILRRADAVSPGQALPPDGLYLTYDSDRPLILLYKGRGWVFKDLYALLYLHLQMRDDSA